MTKLIPKVCKGNKTVICNVAEFDGSDKLGRRNTAFSFRYVARCHGYVNTTTKRLSHTLVERMN